MTPTTSTTTDPAAADVIASLRAQVTGEIVTPEDSGYDHAREVFNAQVDRRPAALIRAAGAADVRAVVTAARERGLPLAVRSGGHSFAGHGTVDGGLVIDLRSMDRVDLSPADRTGWAQGGATTGAYTRQAGPHGLATGFGDTPTVGISGLTLGGGMGLLVRKHGLTIDNLLAAEIVTADGRLRHVDTDDDPDLFWALRGGGGNFGVVTRLRFRLQPVGTVIGGLLILPATTEVLHRFLEVAEAAPRELSTIAQVMAAPPMPMIPESHHGRPVLLVTLVHAGDPEQGGEVLDELRAVAPPLADLVRPMSYPEVFTLFDDEDAELPRMRLSGRSTFVDAVDDRIADVALSHLEDAPSPMAAVQFRVLGGALADVPNDATAYAHRDRRVHITLAAATPEPLPDDPAARDAWLDKLLTALRPDAHGAFVNFMGHADADRLEEAYPGTTLERLRDVKRRYDPANMFRGNHNLASP